MIIRPEAARDAGEIAAVHRAAFDLGEEIPDLVADLRAQPGTLSLVAEEDGVIGHVMLSHIWLDTPRALLDVLLLSPLGVLPSRQGSGVGTKLLSAARAAGEAAGAPLIFLEGAPGFYGERGFETAEPLGFRRPSTRIPAMAFQVARLSAYREDMTGTVVYRDVHWRNGVSFYPDG